MLVFADGRMRFKETTVSVLSDIHAGSTQDRLKVSVGYPHVTVAL